MKVKKMFKFGGIACRHVVQLTDGSYASFLMSPFRDISYSDLQKLPHYRDKGARSEEAEPYMYKLYGLQKQ